MPRFGEIFYLICMQEYTNYGKFSIMILTMARCKVMKRIFRIFLGVMLIAIFLTSCSEPSHTPRNFVISACGTVLMWESNSCADSEKVYVRNAVREEFERVALLVPHPMLEDDTNWNGRINIRLLDLVEGENIIKVVSGLNNVFRAAEFSIYVDMVIEKTQYAEPINLRIEETASGVMFIEWDGAGARHGIWIQRSEEDDFTFFDFGSPPNRDVRLLNLTTGENAIRVISRGVVLVQYRTLVIYADTYTEIVLMKDNFGNITKK